VYARTLVRQVLSHEPRALIYAVVHADHEVRARSEAESLTAAERDRLVLLEGDPSAIDLGLSGAEFRQVTAEVERIHHVAHTSSWSESRQVAHAVNVVGATEILEVARASPSLSCLVFHSTAHVSGDRTGVVYEDDLVLGHVFPSHVDETRMRAEAVVRRAMPKLPIAVLRPTTLVGDLDPFEDDRLDGLYLLVLLAVATPPEIAIPVPGRGDTPLNIVPLEFVVRAAHAIGRSPEAPGHTFHLADPHPLSALRIAELIAKASGKRAAPTPIPEGLAKALLRTPGIERFVRSPRAFIEQLTMSVRYDARNADRVLAGTGIECPSFETYVDKLVSVVQEHMKARRRRDDVVAEVDDSSS
jgi:nucleoside-diphosphate-sugar epimerase